jgi:hypothetical protein
MRKSTKYATLLLGLLFGLMLMPGCKKTTANTPTAPPLAGACNPADQAIYQTLVFAQGSLLNLKATLADPATPSNTVSALTPYYNQAKTDYNIAEATWQGYHAACTVNAAASVTAAQTAANKLTSDLQSTPAVK